ncbi:MAG: RNA 2',3'-cyclic phosphodiesterase [Thermoplasmata archaeon HGW-Thermoplasmata-2]|nr:MAG: RNA 2',3'-cyclic phosphodiesterase [Thermoplasmata archaeon HGW-Thermoplasmata-2]
MFRGFIAVEVKPSPEILAFIHDLENCGADLKTVEPENIHITLKFLGETDEAKIGAIRQTIESAAAGVPLFEAHLKGAGVFPNPKFVRVVWAGIEGGEPLAQIAGKLEGLLAPLGFEKEKRPFSTHLTVARVRNPRGSERLAPVLEKYKNADFGALPVAEIKLKKSVLSREGPTYSDVEVVKLNP